MIEIYLREKWLRESTKCHLLWKDFSTFLELHYLMVTFDMLYLIPLYLHLACSGYCIKQLETGWFKQHTYISHNAEVLEVQLQGTTNSVSWSLFSPCLQKVAILPWPHIMREKANCLPLLIKPLFPSRGPHSHTLIWLLLPPKNSTCKYYHIEG